MFLGVCFLNSLNYFSLSLALCFSLFFLLSGGLEKQPGREEEGSFQACGVPRALLSKGRASCPRSHL